MKVAMLGVGAAALLLTLVASSWAQEPPADELARIEGPQGKEPQGYDALTIPQLMEEFFVPALSIAVVNDYSLDWVKAYGIADVKTGMVATTETLFHAASISKPVAGLAVVRAVQEGFFGLDDDINSILTSWKLEENEFTELGSVTPKLLLSHTAGVNIRSYRGYGTDVFYPTLAQILEGSRRANSLPVRVVREPNTRYQYSSGGYVILQIALVDATKKSFEDTTRNWIFDPLGMKNTSYNQPLSASQASRAARAHDEEGLPKTYPWLVFPEQAAYGLWSTPHDLALLMVDLQRALRSDEGVVLNQEMAKVYTTPVEVGDRALGFHVKRHGRRDWIISAIGQSWGFDAFFSGHRDTGEGIVVMANGDNGHLVIKDIVRRVAREYSWKGY